ncbi:nucleotide exchange factor GrpE [Haloarculaceae archaeon H-GB11]|nr:nucleotide exchange factor GrpE [Haloarculaceae archaeon H-GB1-1]MEA5386171.1 nucleotide exchange factor GrpE [Haloarculaceae archaeon H-GB11]
MTEQDAEPTAEEAPSEESPGETDAEEVPIEEEMADLEHDFEDDLVEYVEETAPSEIADELAKLRVRVDALETELEQTEEERDDFESRLTRKQAEFQNYKKRMDKRREEEKARATEDLVTRLFDVRDNLQRALAQDEDADIRDGVEATFRELDRVFDDEGVEVVEPEPGDEVDPQRHEVLMRVASDQPDGTVADVHRPGYEMGGKVLREAQVTVSDDE